MLEYLYLPITYYTIKKFKENNIMNYYDILSVRSITDDAYYLVFAE